MVTATATATTAQRPTAAALHGRRRRELQRHAAVAIQAAYRGWRTRKRVVWGVRDELDALVADLQRDLQVAQVLLGVGAPLAATANARWLVEGERKGRLHLPRFDDKVFGVAFSLPSPPPPAYAAAALNAQKPIETAPPGRFSSQSGWSEKSSLCGEERDARDPSQAEAAGVTASGSLKADPRTSQLLSVEAILATHSRDEIVLELQWARQALRDRRKYLRSRSKRNLEVALSSCG